MVGRVQVEPIEFKVRNDVNPPGSEKRRKPARIRIGHGQDVVRAEMPPERRPQAVPFQAFGSHTAVGD